MDPKVKEQIVLNNQNETRPIWTDDEWDNFNSEHTIV